MLYLYLSSFNIYIYIQVLSVVRGHWDTIVVPRPCSATVCGWAPQFQQENLPQGSMATWSLWHGYMIWKPKTSGSSSIWKKNTHHESTSFLGQTTVFTVFFRIFWYVYLTVSPARNSDVDVHHVWYEPTNLN